MDIWCPWINTYAMQYIMILYTDFFPHPYNLTRLTTLYHT